MKGISLLFTILALLAAGLSATFYLLVEDDRGQMRQELQTVTQQASDAREKITELTTERDELATRLKTIQSDINEVKARNTTLEARNAQLAREITQIRKQLSTREQTEQATSQHLAELNRQLIEARTAAASYAGGASAEQVAAYEARIANLEKELARLRGDQGSGARSPGGIPDNLTGSVIDVGPESSFVVIDIGARNGAVPSLEMVIRRGTIIIARIRLTDVREYYSLAQVLPNTGSGTIRPGDIASRS